MSFFIASLLTGLVLASLGAGLLGGHSMFVCAIKAFPRSKNATLLLFGSAALWFLSRVWHLSMADFGEYRTLLFVFFSALALLAFVYVPDFLAVRGLAGLILLCAGPLLEATYMQYATPQLILNAVVYLFILAALWLGAQPYRMRDAIEWLYRGDSLPRITGLVFLATGLLLAGLAFTA